MEDIDPLRRNFAARLRRARAMRELSLEALAGRLKGRLTRQAIHKYEQGKSFPSSSHLILLCDGLKVSPDDLLAEEPAPVGELNFRRRSSFRAKQQLRLRYEIEDQLHRLHLLGKILGEPLRVDPLFDQPIAIRSPEDADAAADNLRKRWNLGDDALPDLVALLEDRGVIIHSMDAPESLDGAATRCGQAPVIILARWLDQDPARKRFTLAHELAHLALDTDKLGPRLAERACHRFAGALLIPRETLRREIGGHRRHRILDIELLAIKRRYGISAAAVAYRMRDLRLVADGTHRQWAITSRADGRRREEPLAWTGAEQPSRFQRMLHRAYAEEAISTSKAASLAQLSIEAFRKSIQPGRA